MRRERHQGVRQGTRFTPCLCQNDRYGDVKSFSPVPSLVGLNTLRPRQNGCLFADDIFKRIFLTENVWISITISLKFVPKGPINNIPALVQIMAWRRPGDKPLSEPMMVCLPTHICVTRPQWVNIVRPKQNGQQFVDGTLTCIFVMKNLVLWFKFRWNLFLGFQ